MRKLLLLILLVSIQANSEMISTDGAEWKFFGNNAAGDNFYDINSVKRNDSGVINFMSKTNSFVGESNMSNTVRLNGIWLMSILWESKFDCNVSNYLYQVNGNIFKKKNLVEPFDNKYQLEWQRQIKIKPKMPIQNGSPYEKLRVELCKTIPASTPAPAIKASKVSIDDAKSQCSDIGFKKGTERFGECVLELMQ